LSSAITLLVGTDLSRPKPTTWRGAVDDDDGMSGTREGIPRRLTVGQVEGAHLIPGE
jgi:hypothetical protein